MTDYDKLLEKQILAFDLHKNQSYVERLMKEGEIKGYTDLLHLYKSVMEAKYLQAKEKLKSFKGIENAMKKFNIDTDGPKYSKDIHKFYRLLNSKIKTARNELNIMKATENIFNLLSNDVENSLTSLDILNTVKENKRKYSPDVQLRVDSGKCALKRPGGKKKFSCDCKVILGAKYCKEHLKQYSPLDYTDIFPEGE